MELSFSKKAKLEALDNFKYPKNTCCKENFIRGFFFDDVKLDDLTDVVVQPDIVKSTKIVKKLLSDLEIDSYGVTKESNHPLGFFSPGFPIKCFWKEHFFPSRLMLK